MEYRGRKHTELCSMSSHCQCQRLQLREKVEVGLTRRHTSLDLPTCPPGTPDCL